MVNEYMTVSEFHNNLIEGFEKYLIKEKYKYVKSSKCYKKLFLNGFFQIYLGKVVNWDLLEYEFSIGYRNDLINQIAYKSSCPTIDLKWIKKILTVTTYVFGVSKSILEPYKIRIREGKFIINPNVQFQKLMIEITEDYENLIRPSFEKMNSLNYLFKYYFDENSSELTPHNPSNYYIALTIARIYDIKLYMEIKEKFNKELDFENWEGLKVYFKELVQDLDNISDEKIEIIRNSFN